MTVLSTGAMQQDSTLYLFMTSFHNSLLVISRKTKKKDFGENSIFTFKSALTIGDEWLTT
jgi:hypothetical protein